METVFGLDGEIVRMSCSGSCGVWDRFLGRQCFIVSESTGNGGARFFCSSCAKTPDFYVYVNGQQIFVKRVADNIFFEEGKIFIGGGPESNICYDNFKVSLAQTEN